MLAEDAVKPNQPETLYSKQFFHSCTRDIFNQTILTPNAFYTKQPLQQTPITPNNFSTKHFSHQSILSTNNSCTGGTCNQTTLTPNAFYAAFARDLSANQLLPNRFYITFFPCPVRVVRFHVSPPPSPPPRPPVLRPSASNVPCSLPDLNLVLLYCDHPTICVQCSVPDLRRKVPARPQLSESSVLCRASNSCVQCSLPDRDRPRHLFPAGPQPLGRSFAKQYAKKKGCIHPTIHPPTH